MGSKVGNGFQWKQVENDGHWNNIHPSLRPSIQYTLFGADLVANNPEKDPRIMVDVKRVCPQWKKENMNAAAY